MRILVAIEADTNEALVTALEVLAENAREGIGDTDLTAVLQSQRYVRISEKNRILGNCRWTVSVSSNPVDASNTAKKWSMQWPLKGDL